MPARIDFCDREILENLYSKEGLTTREIAEKFGVCSSTITYRMKEFNIPSRLSLKINIRKKIIGKEELEELYWGKELTQKQISEIFKTTDVTISNRMKEYDIETRIINPDEELDKNIVYDLYYNKKLSADEIGKKFNVHSTVVRRFMRKHNILIRSYEEASLLAWSKREHKQKGKYYSDGYIILYLPNHPSANKHGFVREHVIIWEEANNCRLPKDWLIHHINGIRDDNRLENLVALPKEKHTTWTLVKIYQHKIRELEQEIQELKEVKVI